MKVYNPDKVSDNLSISIKIDGVKGIKSNNTWKSRAGKDLYNLPLDVEDGVYEIFLGNFKSTISACRTKEAELIHKNNLYMLEPSLDKRLYLGVCNKSEVSLCMQNVLTTGNEGLVIIDLDTNIQYKLKNILTFDVEVIDLIEGKGKNVGKLGAFGVKFKNAEFKVGTGFTDKERKEFLHSKYIGSIIEVSGMELLPSGKLRHPRFIRLREDLK